MFARWLLLVVSVFAMLTLGACQIPGTGLPDDGPPVPVSEEAAASFEQKVQEAASAGGQTTLTVTQEEVTSYFALRLNDPQIPVREPQIYFRDDGQIVLRGELNVQNQYQAFRVVGTPQAANGNLQVDLTEGQVGPVPVPDAILSQLEGHLADAIVAGQAYAQIDGIEVTEGSLTVTGEPQQQ